jgi:phage portal protein BeeE
MGLFDKVLTRMGYMKAPQELPKWLAQAADIESLSYPQYTDNNNKLSYFQRVSWVNIAVDKVATIGSGARWNVKRREGEKTVDVPNHEFERLIDSPNPTMSRSDLIYATLAYMSVCNTAYWWVNYGTNRQPVELWLIPTRQISPIPDGKMFIKGYDYDPGDGRLIRLEPQEVIAFNGFNPDSMFTGMSNLDPLRTIMDSDIGMQQWNKKLFVRSNGRLPGILAFADPIPDDDWSMIQSDVDKAAAMRNFMMLRNVKAGGVQWLQATASQKDMEFLNSRLANRDEIYSAIAPGLSSILSVNATEANARIGKTTLIDFKVYPMLQKIGSVLSTKLMPVYGGEYIVEPEDIRITDKVLRLREMAEYSRTHTIDEVRAEYWQDDPLGNSTGSLLVAAAQSPALPMLSDPETPEEPYEAGNASLDVTAEFDAVNAKDMRPALLELEKWERKSKKAGKVAEFTAYNIPAEIVDAITGGATFDKAREMLTVKEDDIDKVIRMLELNLKAVGND